MPSDVPTAETTPEPSAVAVIPARGGSKRIPHKNIRLLNGKPLLAYTVAAALGSGVFARVVVSTDDEIVAAAATAAGATVLERAANLADDHTPASSVTARVAEQLALPDEQPVAQLLPNCPLRTAADVRASYAAFLAGGSPAQLSVTRYGWLNPWWAMTSDGGRLSPVFAEQLKARSQDLPTRQTPEWRAEYALRRAYNALFPEFLAAVALERDTEVLMPVEDVYLSGVSDTWGAARS